jgi:hypothetical protein
MDFAPDADHDAIAAQHLLHGLNPERILLAAMACGIGEAALRRAVRYAGERVVFDRPIGANHRSPIRSRRRTWSCAPPGR